MKTTRKFTRTAMPFGSLLLAAAIVVPACSPTSPTAARTAAAISGDLSDGEILHVLKVINDAEIEQAELALQNSESPELQQTARTIIEQHQNSNQRIDSLAQSGIALNESPLSRGLEVQTGRVYNQLSDLSGAEFDCTFMERQIEQHEQTLDTVRNELMRDVTGPDVEELLAEVEPNMQHHLQTAYESLSNMDQCPPRR